MKLTPVEWLQLQINNCPTPENLMNNIDGFFNEAKLMEKNQALSKHDINNRRELLIAFMEHYRDNDGIGKRDIEAIDYFLK